MALAGAQNKLYSSVDEAFGPASEKIYWQKFSDRFPDDQECLASYLALQTAEVLLGEKPANLLSLANKPRPCGRNLYSLWKTHGRHLLLESGLCVKELCDRGSSILLLLYRNDLLTSLLAQKSVVSILGKVGYQRGEGTEAALATLQSRMGQSGFPHEIGVFLGYPLKDVVGFMGLAPLNFTCQGPWKIFGNPCSSLELAETHRECRCVISHQLATGCNPYDCLKTRSRAL